MANPGRRPRADITVMQTNDQNATETVGQSAPSPIAFDQTPEFQLAVKSAVDAALKPILEGIAKVSGQPSQEADAQGLFRQMALAIAEISDQGTNRKRVAPEILAQRARSHELMVKAILEHKRAHEEENAPRPLYRVIGKCYLNERFIEPFVMDPATKTPKAVEIYWSGPPNPVMRPLNAPATEIFRHYSDSLGSLEVEKETKAAWVTAGGLVIKGEGPQSLKGKGRDGRPHAPVPDFEDDLAVVDNNDPTSPFISVLGTVQPPARRGAAGIGKGAV